jgi:dipeptidyl aminopeptidase/acylaminoacyl peptidase
VTFTGHHPAIHMADSWSASAFSRLGRGSEATIGHLMLSPQQCQATVHEELHMKPSDRRERRIVPSHGQTRRDICLGGLGSLVTAAVRDWYAPAHAQTPSGSAAQPVPLVPRSRLFGNPNRINAQISPDGRHLSWLAPDAGVLNVFVAPVGDLVAARAVSAATKRPIGGYVWAYDNRHLLYAEDADGDENWRITSVDVGKLERRVLTPLTGVHARIEMLSPLRPSHVAIGLNERDQRWHDLWLYELATGQRQLVRENKDEVSELILDWEIKPRLAVRNLPDGSAAYFAIDADRLVPIKTVPYEDTMTTSILQFNLAGDAWYFKSSIGRDRAGLFRVDAASGAERLIAEHQKADIGGMLTDARTREAVAATTNYVRGSYIALDPGISEELQFLETTLRGDVFVGSSTSDDKVWVVGASTAEQPLVYHLYERTGRKLTRLFGTRPELESNRLAPMQGHVLRSRDGLELVSYLTLPPDEPGPRPRQPLAMLLLVHGGPWGRDRYGYHPYHQWLANRGYAVLSVNFRGSTGFGKAFVNAGDREWAGRMHDDLLDGVEWAIAEGIAARDRIAIMGGSYGGYATLVGMTFTPEVFCCGVDIVGPSNLETLMTSFPPYWTQLVEMWARRVGDHRTEAGRALLRARSPLHRVNAIKRPLLIGQGANDPRVKKSESDQIVAAMKARGLPVTYLLFPDEGHGFARPENRTSFNAVVEAFLATHLRGRQEPIGADLNGSSINVPEGAGEVPGLPEALRAMGG